MAEVSIAMANSAAEERAAEKLRNAADDTGDDALGAVVTSGTGTDADAGDYLIKE